MSMTLKIDPEFEAFLLPRPTDAENLDLENQLVAEGCNDPIRIWAGKDVIVDGHRRYAICKRVGIKFKTVEVEFRSRKEILSWMATNQLNRRNLTDELRAYYVGKQYLAEVADRGGKKASGDAAERVGKRAKVSRSTVKRAAKRASKIDAAAEKAPELKEAILDGDAKATDAELDEIAEAPPGEAKRKAERIIAGENKRPAPVVKVLDGLGRTIAADSPFVEAFADRDWFLRKIKMYRAELADLRRMATSPGGATIHVEIVEANIKVIIAELEQRTPFAVCATCKGDRMDPADPKRECVGCGGLGWQDAFRYNVGAKKRKR